jgi:hypothetical protein
VAGYGRYENGGALRRCIARIWTWADYTEILREPPDGRATMGIPAMRIALAGRGWVDYDQLEVANLPDHSPRNSAAGGGEKS